MVEVTDVDNIDYTTGPFLWLAVHYVFNLQYDDKQILLFQFLGEYALGFKLIQKTCKYRAVGNTIFEQNDGSSVDE